MSSKDNDTIRANWRCFLACGFIVLCPIQYGLDFGLIGGLQAMVGFLKVGNSKAKTEQGISGAIPDTLVFVLTPFWVDLRLPQAR